jgi:heme-degrading monooxygenase HmoA
MVVTIFRARVRPDADQEALARLGEEMFEYASEMPGFISYKDFAATDGESVSIIEFASEETLAAWRDHGEHLKAQARGRSEFFSEYHIQVCRPIRESRMS